MLDELRLRLSSDEELRARTAQITYLHAVTGVVRRVAADLGADVADDDGRSADFAVAWRGREVLIRVRFVDEPPSGTALLQAVESMQTEVAGGYAAIGALLVFNTPVARDAGGSAAAVEVVVTWRAEDDDALIGAALARLRPAGQ